MNRGVTWRSAAAIVATSAVTFVLCEAITVAATICACRKPWRAALTFAASIGALTAFACALWLIERSLRAHDCRVELLIAARRFPHCHVKRLHSGTWFLTDRSTGREYRPGPY